MSSLAVRAIIEEALETLLPDEKVIDLTLDFEDINEVVESAGLTSRDPWLGLQYLPSTERPVDILAGNNQGQYREEGVIYLHVVEIAKLGPKGGLLMRAEQVRNAFRGKRLGQLVILEVTPPITGIGATLQFTGGYTACLVQMSYQFTFDL